MVAVYHCLSSLYVRYIVCGGCTKGEAVTLCRVCRPLCINPPDKNDKKKKPKHDDDDNNDDDGDNDDNGGSCSEPADVTEMMYGSSVMSDTKEAIINPDDVLADNGSDSDSDDNPVEEYDGDNEGGNEPIDDTELDDLIAAAAVPLSSILPAGFASKYPIIYPPPSSSSSTSSLPSLVSVCKAGGDPRVQVTIISKSWHVSGSSAAAMSASKIADYTVDIDCIPQRAIGQHEPSRVAGPCGHTSYCTCNIDR